MVNNSIQWFPGVTGLLGYWVTGLLGYWVTGLLGYWVTGLLGYSLLTYRISKQK
ncbi:hypothetical protein P0E20_004307 [Vibrio harveyi]|nr:hypothetical protein [Vibrio harveyi]